MTKINKEEKILTGICNCALGCSIICNRSAATLQFQAFKADEECPVWLGKGKQVHHKFPYPAKTDDIKDFRKVRDDIEREIIYTLVNYAN